jgi:hypothetical protein
MKYYLSLPKGYRKRRGRRWPVLFCVDCAGSNFRALAEQFSRARGPLPCLIVAPCTFSNTNAITGHMRAKYRRYYSDELIDHVPQTDDGDLDWDEAGILAVFHDLRRDFGTEGRFYLTGFSGGGLITYRMIFKHPDLLAGAAPECANFFHAEYRSFKGRFSQDALNFPIHLILGEQDHNRASTRASFLFTTPFLVLLLPGAAGLVGGFVLWRLTRKWKGVVVIVGLALGTMGVFAALRKTGLDAQTDAAAEMLDDLGYPNVKRTLIPGMKHESRPGPVFNTFGPYWRKEKRRSDPLN